MHDQHAAIGIGQPIGSRVQNVPRGTRQGVAQQRGGPVVQEEGRDHLVRVFHDAGVCGTRLTRGGSRPFQSNGGIGVRCELRECRQERGVDARRVPAGIQGAVEHAFGGTHLQGGLVVAEHRAETVARIREGHVEAVGRHARNHGWCSLNHQRVRRGWTLARAEVARAIVLRGFGVVVARQRIRAAGHHARRVFARTVVLCGFGVVVAGHVIRAARHHARGVFARTVVLGGFGVVIAGIGSRASEHFDFVAHPIFIVIVEAVALAIQVVLFGISAGAIFHRSRGIVVACGSVGTPLLHFITDAIAVGVVQAVALAVEERFRKLARSVVHRGVFLIVARLRVCASRHIEEARTVVVGGLRIVIARGIVRASACHSRLVSSEDAFSVKRHIQLLLVRSDAEWENLVADLA